jgi:nucleotide-binding universal stress UspA family protein
MVRPLPLFQRILVGTDGTPRADEAVWQAARLARATDAALEIVHVFRLGERASGPERLEAAEDILLEAGRISAKEDVRARTRLLVGEPASMLVRQASANWCDIVCVGTDAGFAERPHILGGVAAHLVHSGAHPVLVARAPGHDRGGTFPARLLVAVDGSETSLGAVRICAAIAGAAGAELRIVHVVGVGGTGRIGWTEEGREEGFEPLELAVGVAAEHGIRAAREMAMGRPGPAIARLAEEWDADIVAVGTHGRNALGRFALGSVSDWVVRHAGRSVLIARPPSHT